MSAGIIHMSLYDFVSPLHDSLMGLIDEHKLTVVLDASRVKRAEDAKESTEAEVKRTEAEVKRTEADVEHTEHEVYKWAIALRSLLVHIGQRMHQAIKEKKKSQAFQPKTLPADDINASTRRATWAQLAGISYRVDLAIGASGPMVGVSDGDASTEESDSE